MSPPSHTHTPQKRATQALEDVYAIEYMLDNLTVLKRRVLALVGDTIVHRRLIADHFRHANALDRHDTSDGREYPEWMP